MSIFGPSISNHISGNFEILSNLSEDKNMPNLPLNIVDVRDVADIHIRAMFTPEANGQRFIAFADGQISMLEITEITKKRPGISNKIARRMIPMWIIRLGAIFNKHAREGIIFMRMNRNVSNGKAKNLLGWQSMTDNKQIILDSVDTVIKYIFIDNS